jgi:hypothetical protein
MADELEDVVELVERCCGPLTRDVRLPRISPNEVLVWDSVFPYRVWLLKRECVLFRPLRGDERREFVDVRGELLRVVPVNLLAGCVAPRHVLNS